MQLRSFGVILEVACKCQRSATKPQRMRSTAQHCLTDDFHSSGIICLILRRQAACMLVDLGADPYMIDKVIAGFGMPMGPFRCARPPHPCPLPLLHGFEAPSRNLAIPSVLTCLPSSAANNPADIRVPQLFSFLLLIGGSRSLMRSECHEFSAVFCIFSDADH